MRESVDEGRPEVWAGVECTINRVKGEYHDQLARSGHDHRIDDLDRIADLGVRTLRYPVLWERHAVGDPGGPIDWIWADSRLGRLRSLGVRPIVGLVHHGSGPPRTSLTDPDFATGLAEFAGSVARRFPWIDAYTPVNEPLTTARFSGLYGHWHPHGRDDRTFVRCLLTQCRAIALAMTAVREVGPDAALIMTEDLGHTHAPPALEDQARFENERRWLSWDLLSGRVDRSHPLQDYLRGSGASAAELGWFLDHPCPPDILGVNHYVTSERYLDDQVGRYPPHLRGGNGRRHYADVEAVRLLREGRIGLRGLLRLAQDRYGLPLAVTEVHLGCTREEQLRWLREVWQAACEARSEGIDVRAVTAWSLFGAFDWDSLVTRRAGTYESGAFDVRSSPPRPTAVAGMIRDLAAGREPAHPVLDTPGWWDRPGRLLYAEPGPAPPEGRTLLITGGTGTLGGALKRICQVRGLSSVLLSRRELDIADPASVDAALTRYAPWAIVNAAGYAGGCRRGRLDALPAGECGGPRHPGRRLQVRRCPPHHLLVRPGLRRPGRPPLSRG